MNAPTQASRHAKLWFPGLGQLGNSGVALLSPKSIARWGLTIDVLFSKVVLYNNRSVLVHSIRNPDLIRLTEQEIPEMTEEVLHGNLRDSPRFEGMQGLCTLEDLSSLTKANRWVANCCHFNFIHSKICDEFEVWVERWSRVVLNPNLSYELIDLATANNKSPFERWGWSSCCWVLLSVVECCWAKMIRENDLLAWTVYIPWIEVGISKKAR